MDPEGYEKGRPSHDGSYEEEYRPSAGALITPGNVPDGAYPTVRKDGMSLFPPDPAGTFGMSPSPPLDLSLRKIGEKAGEVVNRGKESGKAWFESFSRKKLAELPNQITYFKAKNRKLFEKLSIKGKEVAGKIYERMEGSEMGLTARLKMSQFLTAGKRWYLKRQESEKETIEKDIAVLKLRIEGIDKNLLTDSLIKSKPDMVASLEAERDFLQKRIENDEFRLSYLNEIVLKQKDKLNSDKEKQNNISERILAKLDTKISSVEKWIAELGKSNLEFNQNRECIYIAHDHLQEEIDLLKKKLSAHEERIKEGGGDPAKINELEEIKILRKKIREGEGKIYFESTILEEHARNRHGKMISVVTKSNALKSKRDSLKKATTNGASATPPPLPSAVPANSNNPNATPTPVVDDGTFLKNSGVLELLDKNNNKITFGGYLSLWKDFTDSNNSTDEEKSKFSLDEDKLLKMASYYHIHDTFTVSPDTMLKLLYWFLRENKGVGLLDISEKLRSFTGYVKSKRTES